MVCILLNLCGLSCIQSKIHRDASSILKLLNIAIKFSRLPDLNVHSSKRIPQIALLELEFNLLFGWKLNVQSLNIILSNRSQLYMILDIVWWSLISKPISWTQMHFIDHSRSHICLHFDLVTLFIFA